MNKIKEFFKKRKLFFLSALIFILSVAGGATGVMVAKIYFMDISGNFSPLGNIDFSDGTFRDRGIVISNARNVIVQQDVKIDETIKSAEPSIVGIYKKIKNSAQSGVFFPDNFYKISAAVAQGFIMTSDGWIVTTLNIEKNYSDYAVVSKDKKIYPIDKAESVEGANFYFVHAVAKDFPVKQFIESAEIKPGNLAISVNLDGLGWISSVLGRKEKKGIVKSSDIFSGKLFLSDAAPQEFRGSMVFSAAGHVLGMIDAQGEIEPIFNIESAIKSLFQNKSVKKPVLGINYIDLSDMVEAGAESDYFQKGAIIYGDAKNAAVTKNSPADKAGLKQGDIIISIGNVPLGNGNDLAEIVQSMAVGDKINLAVRRGGTEKIFEIILEEKK